MKIGKNVLIVIGILLFAYILYSVGVTNILNTIFSANPMLILLAIPIFIPIVLMRAYKWKILEEAFGAKLGIIEASEYWLVGLFNGTITPGRVGDMIKAFYLTKKKLELGKSFATVVIDRIFDLLSLIMLSIVGAIVISLKFNRTDLVQYIVIVVAIFLVVIALMFRKSSIRKILRPVFNIFVPEKHKEKLKTGFDDFYEAVNILKTKKRLLLIAFIISIASWLIGYVQSYLLLLS